MKTLTIKEAKEQGFTPHTNWFNHFEKDLLARMYNDIKQLHPDAVMVVGRDGNIRIDVHKKGYSKSYRPDNPKALRGDYPCVRDVVGRESIR